VQQLAGDGVNCVFVRQGMLTLAQPTAEFVRRIIAGEIVQAGDEVTRWMVGNVVAFHDSAGNFKPDKKKSTERIDGVSAAVTGLALVLDREGGTPPKSVWDEMAKMPEEERKSYLETR
jgi:phage terminase large subunit-like protein